MRYLRGTVFGVLLAVGAFTGVYLLAHRTISRVEFDSTVVRVSNRIDQLTVSVNQLQDLLSVYWRNTDRQIKYVKDTAESLQHLLPPSAALGSPGSPMRPDLKPQDDNGHKETVELPKPFTVPEEYQDRTGKFLSRHWESDKWSAEAVLTSDSEVVKLPNRPLSKEETNALDTLVTSHRLKMKSLWEKHYSLLDAYVADRLLAGDYQDLSAANGSPEAASERFVASVTQGTKNFDFPEASYPDLAALRDDMHNEREVMALDVLKFFDALKP